MTKYYKLISYPIETRTSIITRLIGRVGILTDDEYSLISSVRENSRPISFTDPQLKLFQHKFIIHCPVSCIEPSTEEEYIEQYLVDRLEQ